MNTGGAAAVVAAAQSQLGKPYVWDSPVKASNRNPRGFDCSGLAMWCYEQAGVKLPHLAQAQYSKLKHRPLSQAQPADLVFFGRSFAIHHVGIYIGDGQIIEAPDFGVPVRVYPIANYRDTNRNVGIFPGGSMVSAGASDNGTTSEETIYEYLTRTLGFSAAGAAAALGNLQVESGFDPTASNPKEGAIGIAQWENGRRTSLDTYAASQGGSETDLGVQLGYLGRELSGAYSGVLAAMRSATDPTAAAAIWDANFEHSDGSTRAMRIADAQTIYGQISSGATLSGGVAGFAGSVAGVGGLALTPSVISSILDKNGGKAPAALRAYLVNYLLHSSINKSSKTGYSRSYFEKLSDTDLITLYIDWSGQVQGGYPVVLPNTALGRALTRLGIKVGAAVGGAEIASGALGDIKGTIIKVAFSVAGLTLAVLGAYAAAKNTGS